MSSFTLTILGSGTMVATKDKNPAGFLLEVGGKKILLDAGHGTIRRLTDYGFNIQDIGIVFISHFHTDHFGDAFNLVHSRFVDDTYHNRENKELTFWGPKGIERRFKQWRKIYWLEPEEHYPLTFLEGPRKMEINDSRIELFPVCHVRWFPSLGFCLERNGKKLVYTGDIGSCHNFNGLVETVKSADLLITEASYDKPTPNHFSIDQVVELVNKGNVDKVLVVHTRPHHTHNVENICRKDSRFVFAKDGTNITI